MTAGDGLVDGDPVSLRDRAERAIADRVLSRQAFAADTDPRRLVHELQVHEIELAMQCEELRESRAEVESERARYADLYEFAPTGYLTLSQHGRVIEANLMASIILGTDRATLLRGTLSEHIDQGDRHLLQTCLDSASEATPRVHCELKLAKAPPQVRYVYIEGSPNEDHTEIRVSLLDITARRAAEEQLLLRDRAIRVLTHGIVITDPNRPDNPIIYVNAGFENMSGYKASEAIGRNCRFMQGPDTDPATVRTIRSAIKSGTSCAVEILNYKKGGAAYWNALSLTPVLDDDGHVVQFVGVQVDITERRELERALHQAQRMEAIGRLAGGIAHDFNNLLTVINGFSEVLQAELGKEDPRREAAHEIGEAGARAVVLTRQLLAFSRRQTMTLQVLDLNLLVANMTVMLERLIGEDIVLRVEQSERAAFVKADSAQLELSLMNLALSARDAMLHGGTLTVRTAHVQVNEAYRAAHNEVGDVYHASRREMRSGPYIVLSISDTGPGMDGEVAARIFEPFFTTKGVGKGTGLGLSMVYGVVKQSEGYITVNSDVERGTVFSIYLPPAAPEPVVESMKEPASVSGNETVLLVEDDASVRSMAMRVLTTHGYRVVDAGNGREALRVASEYDGRIHLLLTDVVMPEMGGRALADAMRQLRPLTRVLFMSGYPDDEVLRRGIQRDQTAFLAKPFTQAALGAKVREVLDAPNAPAGG